MHISLRSQYHENEIHNDKQSTQLQFSGRFHIRDTLLKPPINITLTVVGSRCNKKLLDINLDLSLRNFIHLCCPCVTSITLWYPTLFDDPYSIIIKWIYISLIFRFFSILGTPSLFLSTPCLVIWTEEFYEAILILFMNDIFILSLL